MAKGFSRLGNTGGDHEHLEYRASGSLHELPNKAADGEKLCMVHAADDVADNGRQYPCRSGHTEVGRLLDKEADIGELQRLQEVVVHATVGQVPDDFGQCLTMFRAVL